MTKIDIFSGFLGAGKTTLIKKLIKEAYKGEKLVLIENEFGQIGIDGAFMQESGIEVTEMNSGCICCSLVGDFGEALKEVLSTYNPDRIIIEPSGVGKLSDVIRAVQNIGAENAVLNSFTTVADVNKCKMYLKNFGEFFGDQIEHAATIILSHTQSASDEKIKECIELLREHNKTCVIVTTPWDSISGETLLEAMEKRETLENELEKLKDEEICPVCHGHHEQHHDHECGCHEHEHHHDHDCGCHEHHHHHADEVFQSWGKETAKKFTKEDIHNALSALSDTEKYGTILRAKGVVASEGEFIHFDYIPGEIDIRTGSSAVIGRLCVIGSDIKEDELCTLFDI